MSGALRFQSGGTLREGAFYVERPADTELVEALLQGDFCYILAPRQIGKSSLRVRAEKRLQEKGVRCAAIDVTKLGTGTMDQWYCGLLVELASKLKLEDPTELWERQKNTTPAHRFGRFLRDEVLGHIAEPVVIFVDEIDYVQGLPFSTDDFFAAVRAVYNARADETEYHRLTFCLIGVAAPGDLIKDPARTPFNIGRSIRLEDFRPREAAALIPGLSGLGMDPAQVLEAILLWTSGHPYMTQRVCETLTRQPAPEPGTVEERVGRVVSQLFLLGGRSQDSNLSYAEKRLDKNPQKSQLLHEYQRLLEEERLPANPADPVQMALRLTGMAAEYEDQAGTWLRARNRIFATVFDRAWVKEKQARRFLTEALSRWLESARKDDYLLRGDALEEALRWARNKLDITTDENEFLRAGLDLARREAESQREAEEKERKAAMERQRRQQAEEALLLERGTRAAMMAQESPGKVDALVLGVQAVGPSLKRHREPLPLAVEGLAAAALAQGYPLLQLRGHSAPVLCTAFSSDGKRLLTAGGDDKAIIWDGATGELLAVLRGHADSILAAAFSPDGRHVVTASDDHTARIWDAGTGDTVAIFDGHTDSVLAATFLPDSSLAVASASEDHTVRVWETMSGKELAFFPIRRGVRSVSFAPDGGGLVLVCNDETVRVQEAGKEIVVTHADRVLAVSYAPSGAGEAEAPRLLVATVGEDLKVRIWDRGKRLTTLEGHPSWIWSLAFSPDGSQVATASADRTARIWDLRSGRLLLTLQGHQDEVRSVAFSADALRIITGSNDQTARVWDINPGGALAALRGHTASVLTAAFSPDGLRVVTASDDRTARIWDSRTGQQLALLEGHTESVISAAFSQDGTRVLTTGADRTAHLFDPGEGWLLHTYGESATAIQSASFSPDGTLVVSACADGTARIWSTVTANPTVGLLRVWVPGTGELLTTWRGTPDKVRFASFSAGGRRAAVVSDDQARTIWIWQDETGWEILRPHDLGQAPGTDPSAPVPGPIWMLSQPPSAPGPIRDPRRWRPTVAPASGFMSEKGRPPENLHRREDRGPPPPRRSPLDEHLTSILAVSLSPDGTRLVSAGADGTARVWDVRTGEVRATLSGKNAHAGPVVYASFSADGKRVVTSGADRRVLIWDVSDDERHGEVLAHTFLPLRVSFARFSPGGSQEVLALSDGRQGLLWYPEKGRVVDLEGHKDFVFSAAFSPDGGRVVTASADGTARVHEVETAKRLVTLQGHSDGVLSAEFSHDGRTIATAGSDETVRIWRAGTGQQLAVLGPHPGPVLGAVFSADDSRIISVAARKVPQGLANKTQTLSTLSSPAGRILSATFSPDGKRVAAACTEGAACVWDANLASAPRPLEGHHGNVNQASFSPDGERVITAGEDAKAIVWDAVRGHPLVRLEGHSAPILSASFSPGGNLVLTASGDATARIWDAGTGQVLAVLLGHRDLVRCAWFSPDGKRVVTASDDHTARIWDVSTGRTLAVLKGHSDRVLQAAFSPDGSRVVTASMDQTARIYPTCPEAFFAKACDLLRYQPDIEQIREFLGPSPDNL